ncbi:MAG TPA: hypothetical protein VHM16_01325 [Rubrobacteraceae bacterium]|nr:hypothetical protein [Rubrobacteraceae bacterium]
MGRHGSAVVVSDKTGDVPAGYERLGGPIPVFHAPRLAQRAREVRQYLEQGAGALTEILAVEPPDLTALIVADEDWDDAPRDNRHPYPPGLPYFTRSAEPPVLVLPTSLSAVFQPRTEATLPLAVWHELAHAFLLGREVVRTPAWFRELLPQAAAAAIARRESLLEGHLAHIDREPGFTVRGFKGRANAAEQMAFQNLLLALGAAALEEFGEGFLKALVHALWEEDEIVGETRAEALLVGALGPRGGEWLKSRPEFGWRGEL